MRLVTIAKALAFARPDQNANFAYVDLEDDFRVPSVEEACRTFGMRIIRSHHHLTGLPDNLDATWAGLASTPGEIPKLAVTPRGAADLARFMTWATSHPVGEYIVLGMGDFGVPSRILAARLGSSVVYSSPLAAGLPSAAPGHLDPAVLEKVYRVRETDRGTAVYALGGGRSVLSSKSPHLHNGAFRAAGINAVYLPIPAENAGAFMAALDAFGATGAAVAVPFREAMLPYLDFQSPEVEDIGTCNTLIRRNDGWAGYNTDAQGFERSLREFLGRADLRGLRATVVGVGGAAKSVAHVLARLGAAGLVVHKDGSKARVLAKRHGFAWAVNDERAAELLADHADLIVQATMMGMESEEFGDPLGWYEFSGRESIFDIVYRPERTALLDRAASAGCKTMNGWAMFRYQAAEQFRLWTGKEPPSVYFE